MATITNIESLNTSHLTLTHKIVDFTPQGDVSIYDRDELNEAFEEGDLSEEQYIAALKECDKVIEEYCSDIPKSIEMFCKIIVLVNERIGNREQLFKPQR